MPELSNLVVDVHPGEEVVMGDIKVLMIHKSGQVVRLCVTAPRSVRIEGPKAGKQKLQEKADKQFA